MKKKIKNKEKITQDNGKYKIFMDLVSILGIIISLISLYVSLLVRSDTAELSKFSDKPIYYTISLYPMDDLEGAKIYDKYINIKLKLVVDDFEVKRKNFLGVNYNATFTKIKYYMVYDYSTSMKKYNYMNYSLDDKSEAKMRFEDDYYVAPVRLNYSLTPNKKYCYILIYTETPSEKNLDLLFFEYHDKEKTFTLDTTLDEKGTEKINTKIIDYDTYICKEYFINLWGEGDSSKNQDLQFMFDVYNDLGIKLIK